MAQTPPDISLDAQVAAAVAALSLSDEAPRARLIELRDRAEADGRIELVVDADLAVARADIEGMRFRDAISRLGTLRELCIVSHYHPGELKAVRFLGNAWGMLGDVLRARALFALGAEMAADLGDADSEGVCLVNQAFSWGETDNADMYANLTLKAIGVFRRAGLNRRLAHALTNLGGARARQRRLAEARSHYAESNAMADEFGVPRIGAFVEGGMGEIIAYEGNVDAGIERIDRATAQLDSMGCAYDAMRQRILKTYVLHQCERYEEAVETARRARSLLAPDTFDFVLRRLLELEAESLAALGDFESAYNTMSLRLEAQADFHQRTQLTDTLYVDERARIQHRQRAAERERLSRDALEISHRELAEALVRERALRESLQMQAITDHLTGLLNRRGFEDRSRMIVPRAHDEGLEVCLMVVDIDRFKEINDRYGHTVGDELLVKITGRMTREFRNSDTFGRWGGDEFAALLLGTSGTAAHALAGRLLRGITSEPFDLSVGQLDATLSIGIGVWMPGESLDAAFRRADQAMYLAKNEGGGRIRQRRSSHVEERA